MNTPSHAVAGLKQRSGQPQSPADGQTRQSRQAFTLVELLVVIAMVSLLIAMLLPALRGAREQVSRVKCLSNLRQRGLAYIAYANDFNELLPHVVEPGATSATDQYTTAMSLQVASYSNNNLAVWWCPDLWIKRYTLTTPNNAANWDSWDFEVQAKRSVAGGGFFKTVPIWSDASNGGFNVWGYHQSQAGSRIPGTTKASPIYLATALINGLDSFPGPSVNTRAPRLSDSPGQSLTVAEMYPTLNHIGNNYHGGLYRHEFRRGDEGGNVLRVDGSARWHSAGRGDADWHFYRREKGTGTNNPKEAVIQPLP